MKGKFLANMIQTLGTTVIVTLFNVLFSVILTRTLGPEGKGTYVIAFRSIGLLIALAQWGIPEALLYYMRPGNRRVGSLAANNLLFIPLISCVIAAVIWLFYPLLKSSVFKGIGFDLLLLVFWLAPVNIGFLFFNRMIQLDGRIKIANILNLSLAIVSLVSLLVCFALPVEKLHAAIIAQITAEAVLCVAAIVIVRRTVTGAEPWRADAGLLLTMLKGGSRLQFGMAAAFLGQQLGSFILNASMDKSHVGWFSTALGLAGFLLLFSTSIRAVQHSWMSSAGGTSDNVAERTVLLFRHSAIILSIGAIIFAIVGRPLIQILYGRAFLPSYVPFVLLLPSIMLQGLSQVLSSFLAFEARFGLASIGAGLMVIVNAVGSFLLIPHFGMAGAAIGTAAGQLVLTVFMLMSVSILSKTSLGEFLPKVSDLQVYHRMIAARFSTRSLKQ